MYSGVLLHNKSGGVAGTHQKINRVARKKLEALTNLKHFPSQKQILHFEGKNGPDGMKRKNPGNEPWHFYDPFDPEDNRLGEMIDEHFQILVKELKDKNMERAAFEAAWLSHAMVDGLTPAHHHPYEAELAELRLGKPQTTIKDKFLVSGETKKAALTNSWKMWGVKGLLTTHAMFELGVASIVTPLRFTNLEVTTADVNEAKKEGLDDYYKRVAREIALLNMYETYYRYGWTAKLGRQTRDELMPRVIRMVTIAWYLALREAGLATRKS